MSTSAPQHEPEQVPFWFDPVCPWAWITSRWLLEVEQVRPVRAEWKPMSLAYLNLVQRDPSTLDDDYRDFMTTAWGPIRVCAAATHHSGPGILGPLYTAIGTRLHTQRRRDDPTVITDALTATGLPSSLAAATTSTEFDQAIIASHHEAFDEVGLDVGTPVLRIRGTTLFGPVVTPAPRGEAAGQLWDGLTAVAATDGFFELKRSRTRKPAFD